MKSISYNGKRDYTRRSPCLCQKNLECINNKKKKP